MRRRHTPQRTCVVCRRVLSKRELVRVVRTPEGQVLIDKTGKQSGRGAYLCHQESCWESALKRNALGHALKTTLSPEEKEALAAFFAELDAESST